MQIRKMFKEFKNIFYWVLRIYIKLFSKLILKNIFIVIADA